MLNRLGRGTMVAVAAGIGLALLFDALTHTEIQPPYLIIGFFSVCVALVVDFLLERKKKGAS